MPGSGVPESAKSETAEEWSRWLALCFDVSPTAILVIDRDGRIEVANAELARIFGYSQQELVGKSVESLIPERFREQHVAQRQTYMSAPTRRAMGGDRRLFAVRRDGTEFPVEIGLSPTNVGDSPRVLATIVDITDWLEADKALRAKTAELERSNRSLEEFAYVVSHDLKSPLRGILALTDWLCRDYAEKLDDEGKQSLELLQGRADDLSRMIDGILAYSVAGRQKQRPSPLDFGDIVRNVTDRLDPPPGVRITVSTLGAPLVADELVVQQILQNLIGNALRFVSPESGVILVSCEGSETSWVLCVRDNGPGIPRRHHERIFRLFETCSGERKSTGIGLAIVKTLAERAGGSARVESDSGSGAAFFVEIPNQGMDRI